MKGRGASPEKDAAVLRLPPVQETKPPLARWVALIALLGTLWGTLYARHEGGFRPRAPSFAEEPRIALHLARGHGYLSPFDLSAAAPPTSWSPPIYPAVMAGAYKLFGIETHAAMVALVIFNASCFALTAAALFVLGSWFVNRTTGVIAAALLLCHPLFLGRIAYFWDAFPALAIFCWALLWAVWLARTRRTGVMGITFLGAALAALALTNSAYVLTIPAILWIATRGQIFRRRAMLIACAFAGFAIAMAPWTIRNYRIFGRLFFVRAGAPLELLIGNRPNSSGISEDVVDVHPFMFSPERNKVQAWGEMAYFDDCARRFRHELRSRPGRFAQLCMLRTAYLMLYDGAREVDVDHPPRWALFRTYPLDIALTDVIAVLSFAGCLVAWRKRIRGMAPIMAIALLSVVPYIPTHVDARYAMPLRALLLLPAAVLLSALAAEIHRLRRT